LEAKGKMQKLRVAVYGGGGKAQPMSANWTR
jgi:hypothetical protein